MNIQAGYGHIGKILYKTFSQFGPLAVYDPYNENCPNKVYSTENHYDIAFICVPTNMKEDGSCDISVVESSIHNICADIFVIKSTIPVGTTENLIEKYGKHIIFSPEFTSTNQHKGVQNFVVLGGERKYSNIVAELYKKIMPADFQIVYTDTKTAEMSKYMMNCFLAMKVEFCNEINKACKMSGIEYDDVRNIFVKDSRINPSHTFVYTDKPYYDSHCFNKDIPAFISQFDLPLMKSVDAINKQDKMTNIIRKE